MSVTIYVESDLHASRPLTDAETGHVQNIPDGWGETAFKTDPSQPDAIAFASWQMNGYDPFESGIIIPLDRLIAYTKAAGLGLNGTITVSSDWSAYDEITVNVKNDEYNIVNTQIANADDEELIRELTARGYEVTKHT